MIPWSIRFFPKSGQRHSPYDVILSLTGTSESAAIMHRLGAMMEMEVADWQHSFKVHKLVDKIFQLPAGDWRVMYFLDNRTIVVIHVCRKVKDKTHRRDISRAKRHYNRYMLRRSAT